MAHAIVLIKSICHLSLMGKHVFADLTIGRPTFHIETGANVSFHDTDFDVHGLQDQGTTQKISQEH